MALGELEDSSPSDPPESSSVDVVVEGGVARVAVRGDLDVRTSGAVTDDVVEALAGHSVAHLVLDMSAAGFVDSTGLGSLIRLRAEARQRGASTSLIGLDPRLEKLLRLTGLDQEFQP